MIIDEFMAVIQKPSTGGIVDVFLKTDDLSEYENSEDLIVLPLSDGLKYIDDHKDECALFLYDKTTNPKLSELCNYFKESGLWDKYCS